jgi:DNA repair protein RadC
MSAAKHNAAALIFIHDQPAGNPQFGDNDRQICQCRAELIQGLDTQAQGMIYSRRQDR